MNHDAQMEKIATKMLKACTGQNSACAAGAAMSVFKTVNNYCDDKFRKASIEFLRHAADMMEVQYGFVKSN